MRLCKDEAELAQIREAIRIAENAYTAYYGSWAPAGLAGAAVRIPWQAIALCERLNLLDDVILYDTVLADFYPRS